MATLSRDTSPEAEEVQIDLLRRAGTHRRFLLACELSDTAIKLSRRAIAEANPDLDERELGLCFVAVHYGQDLADRVRRALLEGAP
jgi:hypothetical protein